MEIELTPPPLLGLNHDERKKKSLRRKLPVVAGT
ncbi:uncharacterized protein G2W53_004098 [Senna tora]|uniref:Uncharacterized protein n=1 Tax=Senna tora TaxID=362788 RepID=A0A835CJ14_9FABA|nr:uncharacterized protein G2W53_004098 [Senna tora]